MLRVTEVALTPAKDAWAFVSTKSKPLPIKVMVFWSNKIEVTEIISLYAYDKFYETY